MVEGFGRIGMRAFKTKAHGCGDLSPYLPGNGVQHFDCKTSSRDQPFAKQCQRVAGTPKFDFLGRPIV